MVKRQQVRGERKKKEKKKKEGREKKHTQLLAQSFSKTLDCSPHCRCAVSASLMLSIIELRSRHSKKASRACQQWARAFRLGASKAPSAEGLGLPTAAGLEAERRPIFRGWGCVYAVFLFFVFARGWGGGGEERGA